jgi:hypothetical protein
MSVQKPQPLIWLARSFTGSCVAAGRAGLECQATRQPHIPVCCFV